MIYNCRNLPIRADVKVPRFLLYFSWKIDALTRNFQAINFLQLLKGNSDFIACVCCKTQERLQKLRCDVPLGVDQLRNSIPLLAMRPVALASFSVVMMDRRVQTRLKIDENYSRLVV